MLEIVVRSKRDRDAVLAALHKFYGDWYLEVETLGGARTPDKIIEALERITSNSNSSKFYIVLLGREDAKAAKTLEEEYILPPNIAVHIVPRQRVRNTRIEHLAREIMLARAVLRQPIGWEEKLGVYTTGLRMGEKLEEYEYTIYNDPYLALGEGSKKAIETLIGRDPGSPPLVVRGERGEHKIYSGPRLVAKILVEDSARRPRLVEKRRIKPVYIDVERLLDVNRGLLQVYEKIALEFIKREAERHDTVVVPWSGGKDSTAVLLLALKAVPRSKLKIVFTDTGTEFPETLSYIEQVSRRLGLKPYYAYAAVDRGLLEERMPMPTHSNRWCTGRKIEATSRAIQEISEGDTLVIVGDREAESPSRALRPPSYQDAWGHTTISPIRLWGAIHVQLYLLKNNIPLNPLYEKGFYRVGCYMCPALRSWEIYTMTLDYKLSIRLSKSKIFRDFLASRIYKKRKEE